MHVANFTEGRATIDCIERRLWKREVVRAQIIQESRFNSFPCTQLHK